VELGSLDEWHVWKLGLAEAGVHQIVSSLMDHTQEVGNSSALWITLLETEPPSPGKTCRRRLRLLNFSEPHSGMRPLTSARPGSSIPHYPRFQSQSTTMIRIASPDFCNGDHPALESFNLSNFSSRYFQDDYRSRLSQAQDERLAHLQHCCHLHGFYFLGVSPSSTEDTCRN
jgi:hypothetical protein